jgi:hypothetical protein
VSGWVGGLSLHGHPAGTFDHCWVDHRAKEFVRGHVHTQTIEGFWALMNNGIKCVFHSVPANWSHSYVDEHVFHDSTRAGTDPFMVMLNRAARP